MTLARVLDHIAYNGSKRPTTGISEARWNAMVKQAIRQFEENVKK